MSNLSPIGLSPIDFGSFPEEMGEEDYIILEMIGEGTDGDVYKVKRGGVYYAMKVLKDSSHYENELDNLKRLQRNPFVINLHGEGSEKNSIIMDLAVKDLYCEIDGRDDKSTSKALARQELERQGIKILKCILKALEPIHKVGYIHHDIKPENILILADGTYVLTDFAYCSTSSIEPWGTTSYISPEVISIDGVSKPASDIYSLGVTMSVFFTKHHLMKPNIKASLRERKDFNTLTFDEITRTPLYAKFFKPDYLELEDIVSQKMVNLIESMTDLDPAKRPNATNILKELNTW